MNSEFKLLMFVKREEKVYSSHECGELTSSCCGGEVIYDGICGNCGEFCGEGECEACVEADYVKRN